MKALKIALLACILSAGSASAQTYNFIFDAKAKTDINKSADGNTVSITPADTYQKGKAYGYDFTEATGKAEAGKPFFFSVDVPDGNYKVTVALGARKAKGTTTVRAESRRLFLENVPTKKGEFKTYSFVVNKRNTKIGENDRVKIKKREENKLNWDDKLTIEINGDAPACAAIRIEPAPQDVPTIWLCGNSTVVDQDYEPWASWGQMIPRWFDDQVCFANYAESGESASTFIAANRLKKILSLMKSGDYIFVEFGHNDQKQKFAGAGAYYNFATCLKTFIDEARKRGATPVFVTPTQRRSFDKNGKITETHADYPDAMRWVAKREGVQVIELHDMTRTFYETLGVEGSKRAFVHYPAGSFPGQGGALADNTHFNPYGAYEISKMVVEGMKLLNLPLIQHLRPDYKAYDPAQPDAVDTFHWNDSPFIEVQKPDGN
ncbi:MAG: rhamnogalacturonan acetylesterase [Bacteroidaceae bacterium]|nr:rhamnogalacturonan acetylesterase [Bacteroidaceae bacterium]